MWRINKDTNTWSCKSIKVYNWFKWKSGTGIFGQKRPKMIMYALIFSDFFACGCRNIKVRNRVKHILTKLFFWDFYGNPLSLKKNSKVRIFNCHGDWKHGMFLTFWMKLHEHKIALHNCFLFICFFKKRNLGFFAELLGFDFWK